MAEPFATFYISALEILLLTYLLTYSPVQRHKSTPEFWLRFLSPDFRSTMRFEENLGKFMGRKIDNG